MTINCGGKLIDLEIPKVMGILNVTPDSFYDGGRYKVKDEALKHTEQMLEEGATFIDVGGQSSRPKAKTLTPDEEKARIIPVIEEILKRFPDALISVDTFLSEVAREAVHTGAVIVNDISAGNLDKLMLPTVAELQVPYIMMHMRGTPKTMQEMTNYENLMTDLLYYFSAKVEEARDLGINDIIVDPGFGFAKTPEQNFELLKKLQLFKTFRLPILMGLSRKSTISSTLGISAQETLNGTTVLNTLAIENGANILRVHDVKEAVECIKLLTQYLNVQ